MPNVDKYGKDGETNVFAAGINDYAESGLRPDDGDREQEQYDSTHSVDPWPNPHLPVPFCEVLLTRGEIKGQTHRSKFSTLTQHRKEGSIVMTACSPQRGLEPPAKK